MRHLGGMFLMNRACSIVLVDNFLHSGMPAVEEAGRILHLQGHRVRVLTAEMDVETIVDSEPPDILVAGCVLRDTTAFRLARVLAQRRPESRVVVLTAMSAEGDAIRDWQQPLDSYVLSQDPWAIVLAVEQCIFRY